MTNSYLFLKYLTDYGIIICMILKKGTFDVSYTYLIIVYNLKFFFKNSKKPSGELWMLIMFCFSWLWNLANPLNIF